MSLEIHRFPIQAEWTGNSDGDGVLKTGWGARLKYGVPTDLGGKPGRSNPEEILVGAVVSCYTITLALMLEKRRIPPPRIEVEAEGEVVRQPDRSLKFTAIHLKAKLFPAAAATTAHETLLDLARRAESACLISRALHGNVEITVEPEIAEESADVAA